IIYSLLGTAKLNGIDPEGYLRYVLERIAEYPINRVDELLPWKLAEQLQASKHEQDSENETGTPDAYGVIEPPLENRCPHHGGGMMRRRADSRMLQGGI